MSQARKLDTAPGTFVDRGIAIPFTTPMLSQARMRPTRQGDPEFLVQGFKGGRELYIMPWRSLPAVMTVTLHDRLLYDALLAVDRHTPEAVRGAVLMVQSTGVAGGDASTAAERALALDQGYQALTQFTLVTELLRLARMDPGDLLATGMTGSESRRLVRAALTQLAQRVGLPPDEMVTRVDALSTVAAPLGLPQCGQLGRLRVQVTELETLVKVLAQWARSDLSEVARLAEFVGTAAQATLALARDRVARADTRCRDLAAIARDFPAMRAAVAEEVERLAWLLDGWPFLGRLWDSVSDRPQEAQQSTMGEMFRLVPLVPKGEGGREPSFAEMDALAKIQARWHRPGDDARGGGLDMNAVMRIEALKAVMT
ncbi:MAG: hypothetical protein PW843_20430 [Azospirillaceae bacterium]|nr:hypothetical protein [Azospirillaceae bacterium]